MIHTFVPVEAAAEAVPSPVAAAERVVALDVLRGFALFGIVLINLTAFKAPGGPPALGFEGAFGDRLVLWGLVTLVESKFFTLFSLLFGVGFGVQLVRAEAKGAALGARFFRRLLILGLFGVLHVVLLWEGDILLLYALLGGVLFWFRKTPPRALLGWVLGLLAVPIVFFSLALGGSLVARDLPGSAAQVRALDNNFIQAIDQARAEEVRIYRTGSYADILSRRLSNYAVTFTLLVTRVPTVLAMFLLGLYVGKAGVLQNIDASLPLLKRVRFWGLGLGLPMSVLVTAGYVQLPGFSGVIALLFNQALAGPILVLGYAATLVLLTRSPSWRRWLAPLTATGRMALTNYLAQSLVLTLLFYSYGFGLAGRVTPSMGVAIAAGIYLIQTLLSVLWLRYFRFGPLEWLWRSLTYGRAQPLRSGG